MEIFIGANGQIGWQRRAGDRRAFCGWIAREQTRSKFYKMLRIVRGKNCPLIPRHPSAIARSKGGQARIEPAFIDSTRPSWVAYNIA
jgi:hypothetical protein